MTSKPRFYGKGDIGMFEGFGAYFSVSDLLKVLSREQASRLAERIARRDSITGHWDRTGKWFDC